MTPTTPSPISDQAAGERKALDAHYVQKGLKYDCSKQCAWDIWRDACAWQRSLSAAPTTGSAPVAFPYQKTFDAIAAATSVCGGDIAVSVVNFAAPTQGADARPVAMTNGSFHCPACGEAMKGPLACGHCLWQKPEAVDAEIGADGIATRDAAPSDSVNAQLAKFLNVAAGEGYVFDGIDAGELFLELFPDYFKNAASAPMEKT